MAKDSLFRICLQGFNKQDVLDYIENLNVRYNKQTKELEGEIDELNKQLEMLPELLKAKENYDKLKEENEILLKEKNDLEEALKAQTSLIEEKDKALEEKDQLIDEAYAENAKCGERIRELEKSKSVSGAGILQKDLISEEFEEILNQARQEAESVMIKARDLAKEIINTAKEKAKIHEIRSTLGTQFCRRCNYCAPCAAGIPIPLAFANSTHFAKCLGSSISRFLYSPFSNIA